MAKETMIMIPFRVAPEMVTQMDAAVKMFGGTKSEFIRRAVEEKLSRTERMIEAIGKGVDIDADPFPAVPSEYHDMPVLSSPAENEVSHA